MKFYFENVDPEKANKYSSEIIINSYNDWLDAHYRIINGHSFDDILWFIREVGDEWIYHEKRLLKFYNVLNLIHTCN